MVCQAWEASRPAQKKTTKLKIKTATVTTDESLWGSENGYGHKGKVQALWKRGHLNHSNWTSQDRIRFWPEGARVDELKAEGTGKKIPPNCLHFKISDMMNIFLLSSISWWKSFREQSKVSSPSPTSNTHPPCRGLHGIQACPPASAGSVTERPCNLVCN